MRHGTTNGPGKWTRAQGGQATLEYLLLVGVVAVVLFTPSPLTNNIAPADSLARAVRSFFRGYSFLISVF
jgi:hypothetical protein